MNSENHVSIIPDSYDFIEHDMMELTLYDEFDCVTLQNLGHWYILNHYKP